MSRVVVGSTTIPAPDPAEWLSDVTEEDVALLYGVTVQTVRRWMREQETP